MAHPAKEKQYPGLLLVEGSADYNFFGHLFVKRGLYTKEGSTLKPKAFSIKVSGDCDRAIGDLIHLKDGDDLQALGLIVDADQDMDCAGGKSESRWKN